MDSLPVQLNLTFMAAIDVTHVIPRMLRASPHLPRNDHQMFVHHHGHWPNVGLILGRPNINPTLGQCILLSGIAFGSSSYLIQRIISLVWSRRLSIYNFFDMMCCHSPQSHWLVPVCLRHEMEKNWQKSPFSNVKQFNELNALLIGNVLIMLVIQDIYFRKFRSYKDLERIMVSGLFKHKQEHLEI